MRFFSLQMICKSQFYVYELLDADVKFQALNDQAMHTYSKKIYISRE